jgi:D-serine deaminase-like pyridoxal phosphate-dependent protein
MIDFQGSKGKGIRPHAKTHKCPVIAQRQIEAGAVGVCAAKVSEAAVLVNAGVQDVLITSPLVTPNKVAVLAGLTELSDRVKIVIDSEMGLKRLQEQIPSDRNLGVVIDTDLNMGRTGARGAENILSLAKAVEDSPMLSYLGIQHYAGHLMHIEGYDKRREKSHRAWGRIQEIITVLSDAGLAPKIVTGGGTGTYNIDCDVDAITDIQVGSYIFMDREYRMIGSQGGPVFDDFEVSLSVAATAISQPMGEAAITFDGGYKAFASDTVAPEAIELAGTDFRFGGDEHGIVLLEKGHQQPLLGEVHRFVTPHCDPTVNLHDQYWVMEEDGLIHSTWPVSARGCSW